MNTALEKHEGVFTLDTSTVERVEPVETEETVALAKDVEERKPEGAAEPLVESGDDTTARTTPEDGTKTQG